jgi:hypothetical protein
MMKKLLGLIAAVGMSCGLTGTSGATVYSVNEAVGASGSVTGTIQTDGNLGTLTTADIISWNLLLNDGSQSFDLAGPNASNAAQVQGLSFTSTANGLFFNFSANNGDFVEFRDPATFPTTNYLCLQDSKAQCSSDPSAFVIHVDSDNEQITTESGNVEIATAVPEPASIALLVAGLAGLSFFRRRKGTRGA